MNPPASAPPRTRTVVITGVARRGQVGEAVAAAFARDGYTACIIARTEADARARASELAADGLAVRPFACNLADPAAATDLSRRVATAVGPVDALVNLAGGFAPSGPVADSDPDVTAHLRRINVDTALCCTRAFLPSLRQRRGAIVFAASTAALAGARVRNVSGYAMAKTAVLSLMRAVAQEESASGVRANAVAPAAIRTATNVEVMPADTRYVEREEVAAAILWLCSSAAAAVTGQVVELSP